MKLLVTGLVLAFVVCSAEAAVDEPFLLMTATNPRTGGGNIIRMHPKTHKYYEISMSETLFWPVAIDFDPEEERIYWTELISDIRRIRRSFLNGTDVETVFNGTNVDSVIEGLALDPQNRLLFYTDATIDIVGKLTLPGFTQETIIDSDLNNPRAIALNTKDRLVYWTDWGNNGKIERANYDGIGRKVLISGLFHVNGLALDVPKKRMYWVDSFTDKVERSDLEGHDRTLIGRVSSTYTFFGLAVYDDILYITDWNQHGFATNDSQVLHFDQDGNYFPIKEIFDLRLNDIHAYSGISTGTTPKTTPKNEANVTAIAAGCSVGVIVIIVIIIVVCVVVRRKCLPHRETTSPKHLSDNQDYCSPKLAFDRPRLGEPPVLPYMINGRFVMDPSPPVRFETDDNEVNVHYETLDDVAAAMEDNPLDTYLEPVAEPVPKPKPCSWYNQRSPNNSYIQAVPNPAHQDYVSSKLPTPN